MNQERTRRRFNIKLVGILAILSLVALVLAAYLYTFNMSYAQPYQRFRDMQARALPRLDKLNEQTLQALPPLPQGFTLLNKSSYGIQNDQYDIGRWLNLSLSGSKSASSRDSLFAYYAAALDKAGWRFSATNENAGQRVRFDYYYKETSCLEIASTDKGYFLSIWQDFRAQPFVSDVPSMHVINFYLIDDWKFATCP